MFNRVKFRISLVVILALTSVAAVRAETGHITITHEVLLEEGVAADPRAIIRTDDGGYVIAGALHDNQAWATRVDSNMKVVWRHELAHPSLVWGEGMSVYESAVALSDNTTLLCGYSDIGALRAPNVVGLLTRIDARGKVLTQGHLIPMKDTDFKLAYLRSCSKTADGAAALGITTHIIGTGPQAEVKKFLWLLGLNRTGELSFDKVVETDDQSAPTKLVALFNSDLLIRTGSGKTILLDRSGSIKMRRDGTAGLLVKSGESQRELRFLSESAEGSPFLLTTFDSNLKENDRKVGRGSNFVVKQVYVLAGGDFALFGYADDGGAATAAVSWLRHDLQDTQTLIFKPTFGSPWVVDAVPTGMPAEFATARLILPARHMLSRSETRLGLLLTLIQFR
jgi:hypothetical protein